MEPGRYAQKGRECCAVSCFERCGERSECIRSDFRSGVLCAHCVFVALNKCRPRRRGERRDERLSSIGVGTGRGTRKSYTLFCRAGLARGIQKKVLTRGRPMRMRRKKWRSSGSGTPEAGAFRDGPLPRCRQRTTLCSGRFGRELLWARPGVALHSAENALPFLLLNLLDGTQASVAWQESSRILGIAILLFVASDSRTLFLARNDV